MLFSIEAGRRCESGPGTFNFESRQSEEILRLIESAIRQQKSLSVAGERHSPRSPRSRSPRSPLPKRPESFPPLDTEGNSSPNSADALGPNLSPILNPAHVKPASPIGLTEAVYANPADSLRSSQITHSDPGDLIEPVYSSPTVLMGKHEPVYAQPDLIKSLQPLKDPSPHKDEPVYSDPVDVIRPNPNTYVQVNPTSTMDIRPAKSVSNNGKHPEPVYSEVYDHVALISRKKADQKFEEPIYSVPEVVRSTQNNNFLQNKMPEENQPIYSKVNKPPKTPHQDKKPSLMSEIVSEDLGLI